MRRSKPSPRLEDLLSFWRGDEHATGWQSPTLALNIARLTSPTNLRRLTEVIYGAEDTLRLYEGSKDGDREARATLTILQKGFELYKPTKKG